MPLVVLNFLFLCSEKAAIKALKICEWDLEEAFDYFYTHPDIEPTTDSALLEVLYDRYKGMPCF